MVDLSKEPRGFDEIPPSTTLVESIRNFGYDLNTAISDLIDNSISAGATVIQIRLEWNNGDPFVAITDDGHGMTDDQLSKNIIIGSKNPAEERDQSDLGRFGLGLKTASFSMCRQLNVFSKTQNSELAFRAWDLDVIATKNKWLVSKQSPPWIDQLPAEIIPNETGTLVLWNKCDRLIRDFEEVQKLQAAGVELIEHLSVFFSKFLEGPKSIRLEVNGTKVTPWNPIPKGARSLGLQTLGKLTVEPFILPAKAKFSDSAEFEKAGGINGWNAQQGFYIYRNRRLIVNGGWLNLRRMKADEHTKLARIILNFASDDDHLWDIDVSKSKASLPKGEIKEFVQSIAKRARRDAEEVYRHKAKVVSRGRVSPDSFVWKTIIRSNGETKFEINRQHPVISETYKSFSGTKAEWNRMLSFIEQLIPAESIQITANTGTLDTPKIDLNEVVALATYSISQQVSLNKSREQALTDLLAMEPFNQFAEEIMMRLKDVE